MSVLQRRLTARAYKGKTRTEAETGVEVTAQSMAKKALENEMTWRVGFVTEVVIKSKESERRGQAEGRRINAGHMYCKAKRMDWN